MRNNDELIDKIEASIDKSWKAQDAEIIREIQAGTYQPKTLAETHYASQLISRHAWEIYGVDPDSPLLREPYVRNDGCGRHDLITGANYGGGLPVDRWGTTEALIAQGWTAADMPPLPGIWGAGSVESYLKFHPESTWNGKTAPTPAQAKDDGNLLAYVLAGLFLAVIIGLPFMLWVGG